MSLRINTNLSSMMALTNLRKTGISQANSLERLSTGLRINRASDDPSGLVISERLRAQIAGLKQAVKNSENAGNMIGTAEAALNEVHGKLIEIRDSVLFAINTGGASTNQIAAEQDSIDNAIKSISRIAATTRFGDRSLLSGVSGFNVTDKDAGISELTLRNVQFAVGLEELTFTAQITASAERAEGGYAYGGPTAADSIIRIRGNLGVQEISVASAMTTTQFDNAINAVMFNTGIYASGGTLLSMEYGSDQLVSVEVLEGTFGGAAEGSISIEYGEDVAGNVNGTSFAGNGQVALVNSNFLTGTITFEDDTAVGSYDFTVDKSGLTYQLNNGPAMADRETIGIISVDPSQLGAAVRTVGTGDFETEVGGTLASLLSGSDNDMFSNPINALSIIDAAIDDVSGMRAYLGSFKAFTIDTNVNSLNIAIENLTASESAIRDVDFAEETANLTKSQILYQAGIAVMAQANLTPQSVLALLQ